MNQTERAYILSCCLVMGFLCAAIVPSNVKNGLLPRVPADVNTITLTGSVHQPDEAKKTAGPSTPSTTESLAAGSLLQKEFNLEKKSRSSAHTLPQAGNLKVSEKSSILHADTIAPDFKEGELTSSGLFLDADIDVSTDSKIDLSFKFDIKILSKFSTGLNLLKEDKRLNDVLINIGAVGLKLGNLSALNYKPDTSINNKPHQLSRPEPHSDALADPVIADLIKENIISRSIIEKRENFSYILNNEALVVQGIRQAEEIYQKMRAKYIKPTGKTTRSYNWINP